MVERLQKKLGELNEKLGFVGKTPEDHGEQLRTPLSFAENNTTWLRTGVLNKCQKRSWKKPNGSWMTAERVGFLGTSRLFCGTTVLW